MTKDFKVKLTEKQDYGTGATRDTATGKGRFDLIPDLALERVAKVYEKGACNHGARNFEQGIPISRMIDSVERHIKQYKMSKYIPELRDEDHLAHSIWGLLGILHFEEMISRGWISESLDDLPRYGYKENQYEDIHWTEEDEARWKELSDMLKKKKEEIEKQEDERLEAEQWLRDIEDKWETQ